MGKGPRTKSSAPGAAKTPPAIGDNSEKAKLTIDEQKKLFATHRTTWANYLAKQGAADKIKADLKEALEADGFSIKMMEIADKLKDVKGEAKIKSEVGDRLLVARLIGHSLGAQMDLFNEPDRTPIAERAYEEGKQANLAKGPAKPPYDPDTEAYRMWMAGFHEQSRENAGGIKARTSSDESTLAHRDEATKH